MAARRSLPLGMDGIERPAVIEYIQSEPIRLTMYFANADPVKWTCERFLQDKTERVPVAVEIDGRRFTERPPRDWDDLEE